MGVEQIVKEHIEEAILYLEHTSKDDFNLEEWQKENRYKAIQVILQEIERLNKKYNKALELLADYNMPCEFDEDKIPDDYCEENCDDDYKKCWDKYIELELKGDSSNE